MHEVNTGAHCFAQAASHCLARLSPVVGFFDFHESLHPLKEGVLEAFTKEGLPVRGKALEGT